jgi:hypothetical protein
MVELYRHLITRLGNVLRTRRATVVTVSVWPILNGVGEDCGQRRFGVSKRVVKKKESASKPPPGKNIVPRVTPNAEIDFEENARVSQNGTPKGPPKIHAKVMQLIVSVGTDDRKRTHEKFVEDILSALKPVQYGESGTHCTVTGGYYILDGVVCLPDDYDPKKQAPKEGTQPPSWAGGPSTQSVTLKTQIQRDLEELSPDEYDKKYGIGKHAPKVSPKVTPEGRRRAPALTQKVKEEMEDQNLEEFDWEEEDVTDDAKMGAVADASASAAIKKMKGEKKRVVKKPAAKPKRKVRVKK